MLNPLEEIISLLRGYFSCPIISILGKEGILDLMLQKEEGFTNADIPKITNRNFFESILLYLVNINLLIKNEEGKYIVSDMGKKVFKRYGSYCLLHSYGDFLNQLDDILFNPDFKMLPKCNRLLNIIGSGQANSRKYFLVALEMLERSPLKTVLDVGCGDGYFLGMALEKFPNTNAIGVDISEISVAVTERNLRRKYPNAKVETFLSDGNSVEKWSALLKERTNLEMGTHVITMWYLLHEISKHDENVVIEFLNKINKNCPKAEIIIGEIIVVPPEILAPNRFNSVIPEYLFFHKISGQGVLSWDQYQRILENIPYKLKHEKLFNVLSDGKREIPSSFIWHLSPK